jgi:hypothetical protein
MKAAVATQPINSAESTAAERQCATGASMNA